MNPRDSLHSTEEQLRASRARALLAAPTQVVPASWPWSEAVPAGPARPLRQPRAAPSPAPESGPSARVGLGEAGRPMAVAGAGAGVPGGNFAVNHSWRETGQGAHCPTFRRTWPDLKKT